MAATNDTIDGLLAEFRGYSHGMPPSYHVTMSWADFRKMLDRFDAAHKHEVDALKQRCAELVAEVAAKDEVIKRLNDAIAEEQRREMATTENPSAVGNCAKLREALEHMVRAETYGSMERDDLCGRCLEKMFARCKHDGTCWVDKAITALSAPPRNCDRPECATTKAAADVWLKEDGGKTAYHDWLLALSTEKEGGNDANK